VRRRIGGFAFSKDTILRLPLCLLRPAEAAAAFKVSFWPNNTALGNAARKTFLEFRYFWESNCNAIRQCRVVARVPMSVLGANYRRGGGELTIDKLSVKDSYRCLIKRYGIENQ
jgi:hypothetical protein